MSLSLGKKREKTQFQEFTKKVGLFEGKVIAINPTLEEYNDILGMEVAPDSHHLKYLGKSKEGNDRLRVDVWLEDVKSKDRFKTVFFLENVIRVKTDGSKTQYINSAGTTTWAVDENDILEWFKSRDYRPAYKGEDDFYNFIKTWLCEVDYKHEDNIIMLDWQKLMKGNVKDLKSQIDGAYCGNVVSMATIKTQVIDGENKQFQSCYSGAFMYAGSIKYFRLTDYSNPTLLESLRKKKTKDQKNHEKFALRVTGEYGCKEYYTFKELQEYNSDDDLVSSDKVISTDGPDF